MTSYPVAISFETRTPGRDPGTVSCEGERRQGERRLEDQVAGKQMRRLNW